MKFFKSGAMFGLDARIALVIFASLSLISVNIIYKHIDEINVVKKVNILNELTKAIEGYTEDTGRYIPVESTASNRVYLSNLSSNQAGYDNWNGPYFGEGGTAQIFFLNLFEFDDGAENFYTYRQSNESWGDPDTFISFPNNCTTSNCYIYLTKGYYETEGHSDKPKAAALKRDFEKLDEYFDGGDGINDGKIRMTLNGGRYFIYIEVYPEFNKMTDPA